MEQVAKLASSMLVALPVVFLNPFLWLILLMVSRQESRMADAREGIYGVKQRGGFSRALVSLGLGTLCGLVGSALLAGLGISLDNAGLEYVWPLAIGLMLINQRLVCFAYAGGLLSIATIVSGWPPVRVPQVMCLVAILHAVEALLIWVDGASGAVPIIMRNKAGRAYGGFVLQRFWPVPIVVLTLMSGAAGAEGFVRMPDWWPLVKPDTTYAAGQALAFLLVPVVAALGYGDMAFVRPPAEKARRSSLALAGYSSILLVLALLSQSSTALGFLAAVFAIAGHEAVIRVALATEVNGEPRFQSPARGIMVLDVLRGSPGWIMGVRSGDVVRRANFRDVFTEADLDAVLPQGSLFLEIEVDRAGSDGVKRLVFERKERGPLGQLGVLFVPKDFGEPATGGPRKGRGWLGRIWGRD